MVKNVEGRWQQFWILQIKLWPEKSSLRKKQRKTVKAIKISDKNKKKGKVESSADSDDGSKIFQETDQSAE